MAKVSVIIPVYNVEPYLKQLHGQRGWTDFEGHRNYLCG